MPGTDAKGIITRQSQHSIDETVNRIKNILQANSVTLFALIDHSGEAAKAGFEMLPTRLLIFGNPAAGTPLMLAAPTSAIDLPVKILVSQDADGYVWLSWNSPEYLQQRHAIPSQLLRNIAIEAVITKAAS